MMRGPLIILRISLATSMIRGCVLAFATSKRGHNRLLSTFAAMSSLSKPSRPLAYYQKPPDLDLSQLGLEMLKKEECRNSAFDVSRKLQIALVQARAALETTTPCLDKLAELDTLFAAEISPTASRDQREANLSKSVEDYVRHKAFKEFLDTSTLLKPSACPYATDEEYLAGACMGLTFDLARYGLGRATTRDAASVQLARDLVSGIFNELLEFDFRNGPLRRKYDGTKYQLQSLETLLYELAVTTKEEEPQNKRSKLSDDKHQDASVELIPVEELSALRERMAHRDELRESLIKRCRDGQKAAKQAIFALHRGDEAKSQTLLATCQECISELMPTVVQEPSLRYGSFSNMLEEYAEAKLFYAWLHGSENKEEDDKQEKDATPSGMLLSPEDFTTTIMTLEPDEYLGGLCDLSGEVTRFAVQRATARDTESVKLCLETVGCIVVAMQTMPTRLSNQMGKKMEQVRRSGEKLERMLYLQSLSEATGGRNVATATDVEMEHNDK